jgi:hypothetical protein
MMKIEETRQGQALDFKGVVTDNSDQKEPGRNNLRNQVKEGKNGRKKPSGIEEVVLQAGIPMTRIEKSKPVDAASGAREILTTG